MKGKVSDVSYRQAVEIIKSGIDSSENLSEKDRGNIAESLLEIENPQSSGQLEGISLSFGPEQRDRLEAYLGQLEEVRQSNIDQEVREAIERVRRLSDLRNELKTRIHSAMDEAKELEQIANKLQDDNLGNIAGKEEREIKQLGEKLQHIDSKAEEVEELEQKISSLLGRLGEKSLKEHLEIKEGAISQILQESSTNNGNTGSAQLNQIVSNMQDELPKLRKAENRGLQELEDDIKTLSSMVELEEREIGKLEDVEEDLKEGNFSQASSILNSLIQRRENFGDESRAVQEIKQDLQEEKKIIVALHELFNSIEQLENRGISRNRLYQKMESKGSFSSAQGAKDFFTGLESEFEGIEEDIARVKKLEQKERKLENLEHEKLKEIDQEDSQLLKQASGQDLDALKDIHEKLQRLNFNLKNEIGTDSGGSSDSSQGISHDFEYNWEEDPNKLYDWDAIQNLSHPNQRPLDQIRDWKRILDKPEAYINMNSKVESLSNRSLSRYDISDENSTFSFPKNRASKNLPDQGFKFHITAYPDEGFDVCRELIPIIQKLGYQHKIHTDIQSMAAHLDENGKFHSVQGMKLMTIYPGFTSNAPDQQDFVPGDVDHNRKRLFINKERTVFLLEKLLELADDDILEGGPQLKGSRSFYSYLDSDVDVKEYRVGNTRIHLTYSFLGSMSRYIDTGSKKIPLKDWVRKTDKNGDYIKKGKRTFEHSDNFRENGKNTNYFLSHLISKQMSENLKEHLTIDTSNKRGGSAYFNYAILGLDGKIAGAYYLPPPECIEEINNMISNV